MIKVTIILTCYKQEKFIEETILSVINQKYANRELLIWDDSPDDNCRNIISKYVKKYPEKIKAWHHNPNKWIVNNMEFLVNQRNKKSEYIAFLEWDDCLFQEYLEKKLEIFKKHPNVQLVYNELTTINEESKILNKRYLKWRVKKFYKEGHLNYKTLINKTLHVSRSSLMIKSNVIKKYGFKPDFLWKRTIISDIFFFNQIAHYEDIYGIEDPLTYYRLYKQSISHNIEWALQVNYELIDYYKYLLNLWDIDKYTYNKRINQWYLLISTISLKKCFSIWFLSTLKLFIAECYIALKSRLRKK